MQQTITLSDSHALDPACAETILSAAQLIGGSLDPTETVTEILTLLADRLRLQKGRILLPDESGAALCIAYSVGLSPEEVSRGSYTMGEGVTGKVMSSGKIAVIRDVNEEPAWLARISAAAVPKGASFIAVPILQDDAPLGVIAVHPSDGPDTAFAGYLYVLQVVAAMIGQILQLHRLVRRRTRQLTGEPWSAADALPPPCKVYGILGDSPALRRAVDKALRAAQSNATVLMAGESGCGKERFARMIHLASQRRDGPFVCINCAAIPRALLESELFGHDKGAFTGAVAARAGKFELAARGTLFLDEIGDMDIDLQAKLLRALQERAIQRLGGRSEITTDVRIVAATNRDLEQEVKNGRFRLDLYFRLNVLKILLPPLRERNGDIKLLALYFLNRENQRYRRNLILSGRALDRLESYDWPGNIRQLENVIERVVIMADSEMVFAEEIDAILGEEPAAGFTKAEPALPFGSVAPAAGPGDWQEPHNRPYLRVRDEERTAIENALRQSRGNKTLAARYLGLTSRQLRYRLSKLQIDSN